MNFARKQLEKYGWSEGKGLGKKENGISAAIKPKLKFDNAGVGHNSGKEFTNDWWNSVYHNALNNIEVQTNEDGVKVNLKSKDSVQISTSTFVRAKKKNLGDYCNFVKTEQLTTEGVININEESRVPDQDVELKLPTLTDDELFAACGGRTAHKGARHGLKLSGKLSRIEKQEKLLLKKLQKVTLDDEQNSIKKKIKKLSDNKELNLKQYNDDGIVVDDYDSRSSTGSVTPKKKCKKKKKSVSFKDTVTEYKTFESKNPDTNEETIATAVGVSKINDNPLDGADDKNKHLKEVQAKQEPFLTNHKKKNKKNTATARFLDNMHKESVVTECKKRKLLEFDDELSICNNSTKKEGKEAKRKCKKQNQISYITDSLDQICKISTEEENH